MTDEYARLQVEVIKWYKKVMKSLKKVNYI
jgi:hypothetical protein